MTGNFCTEVLLLMHLLVYVDSATNHSESYNPTIMNFYEGHA